MNKASKALMMAHYLQSHAAEQQPLSGKNKPQTWSERLRLAWFFVKFNEALKDGVVTFSFWKKDGSIREAKGTLHPLLIPFDKHPKGTRDPSSFQFSTFPFFDLDKGEWRSFSITHFIGFVTIYQLTSQPVNQLTTKKKKNQKEKIITCPCPMSLSPYNPPGAFSRQTGEAASA